MPYEREVVDPAQKTPIDEEMVKHMESNLSGDIIEQEVIISEVDEDGWETLELPDDSKMNDIDEVEIAELQPLNDDDERAKLEAELARIDASWQHRSEPASPADAAMHELESKLSDLDL
mgnify:FL=1